LLDEQPIKQSEIVVIGENQDNNLGKAQMGMQKLTVGELQTIPVLLGERDVLKTIQCLPGVQSAGDGTVGFYVRGGSSDQNLILLDEATVYNASHLLGLFSVFNSDAIKDVTLYKGDIPAEYGSRLSSVLDMKMKDGNDKTFGVSGGIGLISSRLNIEGPIVSGKGSFSIAARRTYADLFLKLSTDTSVNQSKLYFYDLNAKANYQIDDNNRVFLSGYFGKDVLGFENTLGIDWGNTTATLRWNHLFGERMFCNTSFIFSKYDYSINLDYIDKVNITSRIHDFSIKQDFQYFADARNGVNFGFVSIYHTIVPGMAKDVSSYRISELNLSDKYGWENALYVSHEYKLSERMSLKYGGRLTTFSMMGPGNFYSYDEAGIATDTVSFSPGIFVKTYLNIEPRIAVSCILNENSSVKASYGRTTQNLHLISNSTSDNPTDIWIPSSNNVRPEIADQFSLGYFRNFDDNEYECSTEIYYKSMQNEIDYKNGADLVFNDQVESQLLFGKGRSYGIELFLKKKYGRFNGWIGYTLSRTERQIDGVNNGSYYPARQDRTHDISLIGMYQLSDSWVLSSTWIYYTGNAVTYPSGKYEVAGNVVSYYSERNGGRMPPYHRLDIGATWKGERSSWTFSLYNAYGRDNPYTITFRRSKSDPTKTEAVQTSLFKFVPSITYNFKF
jgi:hypothetical protein